MPQHGYAFMVSEDDIETMLRRNAARFSDSNPTPFHIMAESFLDELDSEDFARIESNALRASCDIAEQTEAALDTLATIACERGLLI